MCISKYKHQIHFIHKLIFPTDSLNVVESMTRLFKDLRLWRRFYSLNLMHECTAYWLYYTTVWNWLALLLHVSTLVYLCALIVNKYSLNSACVFSWSIWCRVLWVAAEISEGVTLLCMYYTDFIFLYNLEFFFYYRFARTSVQLQN